MRRVNIVTGIKQRLNEILGRADTGSGVLTAWSIQAAMLSNFNRIGKALLEGSSTGKILSGFQVTESTTPGKYNIAAGYGVNSNGDFISMDISTSYTPASFTGTKYLCAKYELQALDDLSVYGKRTSVIGSNGIHQIVFDEIGAASSAAPTPTIPSNLFVMKDSLAEVRNDPTLLLLATLTQSGGTPTSTIGVQLGRVIARKTGSQTILPSAYTIVIFDEVVQNTANEYDPTSGIYTAATDGFRQVSWGVNTSGGVSYWSTMKNFLALLSLNGENSVDSSMGFRGSYLGFDADSPFRESKGSALIYMSSGDTLSVKIIHNADVSVNTYADKENENYFTICTMPN